MLQDRTTRNLLFIALAIFVVMIALATRNAGAVQPLGVHERTTAAARDSAASKPCAFDGSIDTSRRGLGHIDPGINPEASRHPSHQLGGPRPLRHEVINPCGHPVEH
jgi:hypothetical protein